MSSQGGELLQLLRGLDQQELKAIRRNFDWCSIEPYDGHRSFTKRLRDSIDRAVSRGDTTYSGFMESLRDEILKPGPYLTETRVKRVLRDVPVSMSPIGKKRKTEEWLSAQLYGALQNEFQDSFNVYVEHTLHPHSRERADIYLESVGGETTYLVESKVASSLNQNIKKTEGQLELYDELVSERDHTFVVIFGKINTISYASSDQTELAEYTDIPSGFSRIGNMPSTTVIERVLDQPD